MPWFFLGLARGDRDVTVITVTDAVVEGAAANAECGAVPARARDLRETHERARLKLARHYTISRCKHLVREGAPNGFGG